MNIVCCTDHGYIMPTGIMLKSLAANHCSIDLNVFVVVDQSVTSDDMDLLEKSFGGRGMIRFFRYQTDTFDFPLIGVTNKHVTAASYLRLFLMQILPKEITKVIYLDGDTIVRQSLVELWSTNIEGFALGAVKDMDEYPNLNRMTYPH